MKELILWRLLAVRHLPPQILLITAGASYGGLLIARVQGWPLWGSVLAVLIPWLPILGVEMVWTCCRTEG